MVWSVDRVDEKKVEMKEREGEGEMFLIIISLNCSGGNFLVAGQWWVEPHLHTFTPSPSFCCSQDTEGRRLTSAAGTQEGGAAREAEHIQVKVQPHLCSWAGGDLRVRCSDVCGGGGGVSFRWVTWAPGIPRCIDAKTEADLPQDVRFDNEKRSDFEHSLHYA